MRMFYSFFIFLFTLSLPAAAQVMQSQVKPAARAWHKAIEGLMKTLDTPKSLNPTMLKLYHL